MLVVSFGEPRLAMGGEERLHAPAVDTFSALGGQA